MEPIVADLTHPAWDCLVADCSRAPAEAPVTPRRYAGVDLMARDYDSLLRLMLDRLAREAPDWRDRSEADLGMVLLELFAYAGDQVAWLQERVALEGRLRTATHPESVRRLLRLIDHASHPGQSADAWLQFEVTGALPLVLPAGFAVSVPVAPGLAPDAAIEPVVFETFADAVLAEPLSRIALAADAPGGADGRELRLAVTVAALLPPGSLLVLQQGARRELVEVASATPGNPTVVQLREAPFGRYVAATASAHGNLVRAGHGQTQRLVHRATGVAGLRLRLEPGPVSQVVGANGQPQSTLTVQVDGAPWSPVEDFIDSQPGDAHFRVSQDAFGDTTVLFGDGEHGAAPPEGALVALRWRAGLGPAGRVGPDALTDCPFDTAFAQPNQRIVAVRNPLASAGARPPDRLDIARLAGPAALARLERAVTAADHEAVLAEGVMVQGRRWMPLQSCARCVSTGRGPVMVVSVHLSGHRLLASVNGLAEAFQALLDERRLAGQPVQLQDARWCPLHVVLRVQVQPDHFARDVRTAVEAALLGQGLEGEALQRGAPLFAPGRLGFGEAVHLSELVAQAAAVEGVAAVVVTRFKRLGDRHPDRAAAGFIEVGALEVARCEQPPRDGSAAEQGLLVVRTIGGREG
jgi:hypothetical protein